MRLARFVLLATLGAVLLAAQARGACTPGLTVGGKAYDFASCDTVPLAFTFNGYSDLEVHTSVEADGAGSLLHVGLSAKTPGWIGFGLGRGMMGNRVIAWTDGKTAAQVAGFKINDFDSDAINAAKGTFKVQGAAAEYSGGRLKAVFTIPQPTTPASKLASKQAIVWAMGVTGGAVAPGIEEHAVYDSASLTLKQAAGTAAAAPAPAAAAEAAKAPAAEAAAQQKPEDAKNTAGAAQKAAISAAAGAAAALAPAAEAAAPAAKASCTLQLGGQALGFTGCRTMDVGGRSLQLLWKAEPLASDPAKSTLTLGLSTPSADGYVSVGFPSRPGKMVGGNAMVLAPCSSGAACTSGAALQQFYLGGESQSDVSLGSNLAVEGAQAAVQPGGGLAGTFSMVVATPARRRGLLAAAPLQQGISMPLIFAAGPATPEGGPTMHDGEGAATLPLLARDTNSALGGDVSTGASDDKSSLKAAHGWLAAIGWGVLVPLGIVLARGFKQELANGLWFHLHRILQTLGFVMGTVSLGLGFAIVDGEWATDNYKNMVHRNLGVACTVLGFLQFSALVWRPAKGQKYRFAWEQWHHWVGRAATVLAITNIYWGCLYMWDLGAWAWGCYTAVLAVIAGAGIAKELHNWRRARGEQYKSFSSGASTPTGSVAGKGDLERAEGDEAPSAGASAKVSTAGSFNKL